MAVIVKYRAAAARFAWQIGSGRPFSPAYNLMTVFKTLGGLPENGYSSIKPV